MGRFDVIEEHAVKGTEQVVYLKAMSAESTVEFRGSVLASLVAEPSDGEKGSTMDDVLKVQAENIAAHTYDDRACSSRTWGSADDVWTDLSAAQIDDLGSHLLAMSGFNVEAATAARRFQENGEGEAGGVPDPQHGEGVREAAVGDDGASAG